MIALPALLTAAGLALVPQPLPKPAPGAETTAIPAAPVTRESATLAEPGAAPSLMVVVPIPAPRPVLSAAGVSAATGGETSAAPAVPDLIIAMAPPRPVARPKSLARPVQPAAAITPHTPPALASARGTVCQDPRLVGTVKADIVSANSPCGVLAPVRIEVVAGIRLSTAATLNCPTARRFADWLTAIADPAAKRELGAPIREVWVMGSYACRTRNHQPGARISEHARGRAVDVGGVTLSDGQKVTVKGDWGRGAKGRFLDQTHKKACGLFHTVLGPESDKHHQNHFHFDTAQRGGSPYCR
ncbi:MAG: extensin family protein [Pseudomonadota bacterium]